MVFDYYIYGDIISTDKIPLMLLDGIFLHSIVFERIFGIFLYHKTLFFGHVVEGRR